MASNGLRCVCLDVQTEQQDVETFEINAFVFTAVNIHASQVVRQKKANTYLVDFDRDNCGV